MRQLRNPVKARDTFATSIARAGLSLADVQRLSGVSKSTLFGMQNPSIHATRTQGSVRPATAWKIANAYAAHTQTDPEAAFDLLFCPLETPSDPSTT
jgi:hypothetical protein